MNELDNAVRESIKQVPDEDGYCRSEDLDSAVEQITQAFVDAGWKYDPIERVRYNPEAENYSDRFPQLMTGQEWYDRFKEEFGYIYALGDVPHDSYKKAKVAAKKASGIE